MGTEQECLKYDCGGQAQPYTLANPPNACDKGTRPIFRDYLSLPDLRRPRAEGEVHPTSHRFHWEHPTLRGKQIKFRYEVNMADNLMVVNLDVVPLAKHVHCRHAAGLLRISSYNESGAHALASMLDRSDSSMVVAGGREWKCLSADDTRIETVMRRVVSVELDGLSVNLRTTKITYVEIFKHASVSLEVGVFAMPGTRKGDGNAHEEKSVHHNKGRHLMVENDDAEPKAISDCTCPTGEYSGDGSELTTLACAIACTGKVDVSQADPEPPNCAMPGDPNCDLAVQYCTAYLAGSVCKQVKTVIQYQDSTEECDPYSNHCYCTFIPGDPVYPNYCYPSEKSSVAEGQRVSGFWDAVGGFISDVWHAVQDVASDVEHAAEAAAAAAKVLFTGDLSLDNSFEVAGLAWNYDASSSGASQADLDFGNGFQCNDCYVNLDASVHYDIEISDYNLNKAAIWLEGDANIQIHATMTSAEFTEANSTTIATIKPQEVSFTVAGIPMVIDTTIPVEIGYNATISEQGTAAAVASISGHIKKGVLYADADDKIHFINEMDLTSTGSLTGPSQMTAALQVYVFPKANLICDHLGGPTIGLKGMLELVVDYQPGTTDTCHVNAKGEGGLFANLNFGVQTALGAKVNITMGSTQIFTKVWPSLLTHTYKYPVLSGCRGPAGEEWPSTLGEFVQPTGTSVTYAGVLQSDTSRGAACTSAPSVPIALQVVTEINAHKAAHQLMFFDQERSHISGVTPTKEAAPMLGFASAQNSVVALNATNALEGNHVEGNSFNAFSSLQLPYILANGQLIPEVTAESCFQNPSDQYCYTFVLSQSPEKLGMPNFNFNAKMAANMDSIELTDTSSGTCYPPARLSRGASRTNQHNSAELVQVYV